MIIIIQYKKYGSFVFIGEIITDMKIDFSQNKIIECIGCNKCIKACPTKFLYQKENNCLSNITQQKRPLDKFQESLIKKYNTIWGCDICQNVCPMNKGAEKTYIDDFINSYRNEYVLNENSKNRAYTWRGEDIIKRNFKILNDI